jgi:hypothetical protein
MRPKADPKLSRYLLCNAKSLDAHTHTGEQSRVTSATWLEWDVRSSHFCSIAVVAGGEEGKGTVHCIAHPHLMSVGQVCRAYRCLFAAGSSTPYSIPTVCVVGHYGYGACRS